MNREEKKIYYVQGIPVPETPVPRGAPEAWRETRVVGTSLPRVDAYERVSGSAIYASDLTLPGMLYAAILRSPHAHAIIKRLDTAAAKKTA
jgi:xanthine dehydrogenase YagR molybdenum-binding subunit